jgi:hypothetical protein
MGHSDVAAESTYRAIGRFMFEFSQLEYAIKHYVAEAVGIQEMYFHAVMSHDFALLCTVATEVLSQKFGKKDNERLRSVMSRARGLNTERVRVAHGLWVPFLEGGTVHHVTRNSLKPTLDVGQAQHLEDKADEVLTLRMEFERIMTGVATITRGT